MIPILLFFLFIQGCITGVIGVGGLVYKEGNLETQYAAPYEKTWNATLSAMQDMRVHIVATAKDATKGVIQGKEADGTNVRTTVEPSDPQITSVTIRVGIMGDEKKSRAIEHRIRIHLGKR